MPDTYEKIAVNKTTGEQVGLLNGQWVPIQKTSDTSGAPTDPILQSQYNILGIVEGGPEAKKQQQLRTLAATPTKGAPLIPATAPLSLVAGVGGLEQFAQQKSQGKSTPGAALIGAGTGLGAYGIGKLAGAVLPKLMSMATASKQTAGAALNTISATAGEQPIPVTQDLAESLDALNNFSKYNSVPKPISSMLRRFQRGPENVTYDEARTMYSALSGKLAPEDLMKLNKPGVANLRRLMGDTAMHLDNSISQAAETGQTGFGDLYQNAMGEYHAASQYGELKNGVWEVGKKTLRRAAGAGVTGAALGAGYELWNTIRGK